ncbi:MAG: nickel pincer cofactor biosynthesis protein LarB [Planctomycetota bacterium]|nr:nickel pincer cofactor biosynthesis protein LarB [Planctomycetota bacterium]
MDAKPNTFVELCRAHADGRISAEVFWQEVGSASGRTVSGSATVDLDRIQRCGFPEVVFGQGKTNECLVEVITVLRRAEQVVLCTRVSPDQAAHVVARFPDAAYSSEGRTLRVPGHQVCRTDAFKIRVPVVTAGSADLPVAEEARQTLLWMGFDAPCIVDVGVAGPWRLLSRLHELAGAAAIVVVAGMEGALPSVVGGHVPCPVIAVPTSVGYGANFQGLSALLGMLNSCAANVVPVNIDAGFKGGYFAGLIAASHIRPEAGSEPS